MPGAPPPARRVRGLQGGPRHQPPATHLRHPRQLREPIAQALAEPRAPAPAARGRRSASSAASGGRGGTGAPAKVEPWSPRWSTSASSGGLTTAPTGRPPPSAFAAVITSGVTGSCLVGPQRPGPPPSRTGPRRRPGPRPSARTPRARRSAPRRRSGRSRPRPGSARHHRRGVLADGVARAPAARRARRDEALRQRAEEVLAGELRASPPGRRGCARGRPPSRVTICGRSIPRACACLRTSLIAVSVASAPELVRNTPPPRLDSASRLHSRSAGSE